MTTYIPQRDPPDTRPSIHTTSSWLPIPTTSDFTLSNLPFGIISLPNSPQTRHIAVAIGDHVLDLYHFSDHSHFLRTCLTYQLGDIFKQPTLNAFAAIPKNLHESTRQDLQEILRIDTRCPEVLRDNAEVAAKCLFLRSEVTMHLPFAIGDYTDFYAGLHHAYNVGVLFRGAEKALQPNYRHLPVGYHGRASSVVVSETPITRPWGQVLDPETKEPVLRPSEKLDLELELGAFVCGGNEMGSIVPIAEAEKNIFGYVLLNDWSARDIQAWEYVPLGPFNGKNFGTTVSPWVVLASALEPFRCRGIENDVEVSRHLKEERRDTALDIALEVDLITPGQVQHKLTRTTAANLLFSFPQMLAHHSVGGCPMRTGDLLGSGTISGTEPGSQGSLLEQSHGGKQPLKLADSDETRTFLQDGDTIVIRGSCKKDGIGRVGFGECRGTIRPAIESIPPPSIYELATRAAEAAKRPASKD